MSLKTKNKIGIVGIGYVGLSNAISLSINNNVVAYDIDKEKVSLVNNKKSPLSEPEIAEYLEQEEFFLQCTTSKRKAFIESDFILIATPTNYDDINNYFDTSTVESVIKDIIEINTNTIIIIRSTVPVGFVDYVRKKYNYDNIIFCPEFLREGHSLSDNFYPSRIIVGGKGRVAETVATLLLSSSKNKNTPIIFTGTQEAEAIKLFANSYLAMRVAFFNELDTYSLSQELNTRQIIEGVSYDSRIGEHYNNPSFGYGGYCLPKDTKQLLANYKGIPNQIIKAIVDSNVTRKEYIVKAIVEKKPTIVGIYRLIMKADSDNFRSSAVLDIIKGLLQNNIKVIIYEPVLNESRFFDCSVENDLPFFKNNCDLIIANRTTKEISDVQNKIFTRDIFGID